MSTDSDSDVCDFSSDLNKHMSKGLNKFWKGYKEVIKAESNAVKESDEAEEAEANALTEDVEVADAVEETVGECVPVYHATDEAGGESVSVCRSAEATVSAASSVHSSQTNTFGSIVNKLNTLSETIKDILEEDDGRKVKKRRIVGYKSKSPVPARQASEDNQTQTNNMPILTLDKSSDDEASVHACSSADNKNTSPANNVTELNPTVMVKVLWKSVENKLFKVKKFQPLQCIYQYYMKEIKIDPKLLFFSIDNKQIILQDNSYVSLRLNEHTFIEGGVLPESYLSNPVSYPKFEEKNLLKLKIQYNIGRKKELVVGCKTSDKIDFVMWHIVKEVKLPVESIKLYFDGRLLKADESIDGLRLEEGDCFDLRINEEYEK